MPVFLYGIVKDHIEKRALGPKYNGTAVAENASGVLLHLLHVVVEDMFTIHRVVRRTSTMMCSALSKLLTHTFLMTRAVTGKLQRLHAALGRLLSCECAIRILAQRLGSRTPRGIRYFANVCRKFVGSLLAASSLMHQRCLPFLANMYYIAAMSAKSRAADKSPLFSIAPVYAALDGKKLPSEFTLHKLFGISRKQIGLNEDDRERRAHSDT